MYISLKIWNISYNNGKTLNGVRRNITVAKVFLVFRIRYFGENFKFSLISVYDNDINASKNIYENSIEALSMAVHLSKIPSNIDNCLCL